MSVSITDGAWPILLTSFTADDKIDLNGLDSLLAFYQHVAVPGLLALGQASEVLALTDDERFQIAAHVAQRCQGKLTVAAVGNFGATLEAQAESLKRMVELGIDVAVVGLSLLPSADQLDEQLLTLANLTGASVPLGIYELPEPEHRLLSPEQVSRIAQSGRYFFMKDTCRQITPFTAKVRAAQGSPLKLFQANLRVLPESMEAGSHGFCGWMPIVASELCSQVIDLAHTPQYIRHQAYLKLLDFQAVLVEHGFPASAKYVLKQRGVNLESHSRVAPARQFTENSPVALDLYLETQKPFVAVPVG
jgi:4-hydroxy-tetrahydrodipicolinate synthase